MTQTPILIILAGGASSRMWPLREKSLLRFGPDPLLLHQLKRYQSLGFEEAILVGNPENAADMQSIIAQMADMRLSLAIQQEAKGMGDALLTAAAQLAGREATAVYITQVHDVVAEQLHQDMLQRHRANPQHTLLAGYELEEYFPGGYLIVDENGKISGIIEKPAPEQRPSRLVNIVAHIHAHAGRLFDAIRAEYAKDIPSDDHYERAMAHLMSQYDYYVVPYRGRWNALKYPWHVLDVMDAFLAQIKGQTVADDAYIAPTATLVGDVWIGAGAKVFPGTAVVGPAYIGARTIVGNNALVRQSMVLDHCEVGFTTEVARSYVASRCALHACRVLDSIFAEGVNFSAGCTTANLRIDKGTISTMIKGQKLNTGRDKFGAVIGEAAFLSVDVMTMPGVKIGSRAQIGPGTHVYRDVADNARVYVKQVLDGDV